MWVRKTHMITALVLAAVVAMTPVVFAQDDAGTTEGPIQVRFADHEGYSRVVFHLPAGIEYDAVANPGKVVLRLSRLVDLDLSGLAGASLNYISAPVTRVEAGILVVELTTPPDTGLRHFKSGTWVVLDILAAGYSFDRQESVSASIASPSASITSTAVSEPETPVEVAPVASINDRPVQQQTGQQAAEQNDDQSGQQPEPANAGLSNDPPIEQLAVVPTFSNLGDADEGDFKVSYATIGGMPQMTFEWAYPVAAAVFMRAGYLWIVFDEPARANLSDVIPYLNDRLVTAEQVPSFDATLLRFQVSPDVISAVVSRSGSVWNVSLSASVVEPQTPIVLARQETNQDGFRIFIPFERPGAKLSFVDPEVGDELEIIPLLDSGRGTAQNRRFAQFEILATGQGLVVQKYSDQVVVTRFVNGVSIGSIANLALSAPQLQGRLGEMAADTVGAPQRIIELEKWRLGGARDFSLRKQELYRALATSPIEDLNDRRWDIARFYLGHHLASEAMATLNLMLEEDPTLTESPPYRAVRGLSNFWLGRLIDAQADLDYNQLDAENDIYLWRGLVAEARGETGKALQYFERGRDVVELFDNTARAEFRISAMRAAMDLGRIDFANWELTWLRRQVLGPFQRAQADYLEGRFLEAMGKNAEAMAYYEGVDERENHRAASLAKFALAKLQLLTGEIDTAEATERMEQLRFSWRGDRFELDLLRTLGDLYLTSKQYRHGLETLREAVSAFPEGDQAREVTAHMAAAFSDLFLNVANDDLPPISALALYYDFRELTPLGAAGDQMIRRLSDRLVAVDLLERAAELLDHQVRFRLEGSAQANIATRLAKIHLMNRDPNKAMQILRLTRQTRLPADVMIARILVEARALIELKQYEEADVLLSQATGPEVAPLRADIYWGARDWPQLVNALDDILGRRWENIMPLDDQERLYIIRKAIANSMQENASGLATMRARYLGLMQNGRFANALDIITSPDAHSSTEIRDIVRQTAAVDSLQSFMMSYRQEFLSSGDSDGDGTAGADISDTTAMATP